MKLITVSITEIEYRQIRALIMEQDRILSNRKELLNGTKLINPSLIVCSFLNDRYLFMYDVEKAYEKYGSRKEFKFEIYQVEALSYFLDDILDIPYNLDILNKNTLKVLIDPYKQVTIKDDFQQYFESELSEMYDMTYTELRDERPWLYDTLYKKFNLFNHEA